MIDLAIVVQILVWLVLVAVFLSSGQASLFHPVTVYLFFHGLVFILRPVLVHYFGFEAIWKYMGFVASDEIFIRTLLVGSVGLVCFVTACLIGGWTRISFGTSQPPQFSDLERRALLATCRVLLPVVAYSIYATRNGIEGQRVAGVYIMTNSTGYLNEAQNFVMPLLCACFVVTRFHWGNLLPALIYMGYRAWFGWSRWTILLFLLMACLSYCWYYRRKWIPVWTVVALVPVLFIFNVLGHNRDLLKQILAGEEVQFTEERPGTSRSEKLRNQLDTQDFANFDYLAFVVSVIPEKTEDFSYGAQYLQLFTEPIPRILWKGKPVGAPVRTINMAPYGNFLGLTVSLCGDGWMSGGWAGLVITLSLAGLLIGYAHRRFWEHNNSKLGALIYIVALAMVPQWYRDGGISVFKFLLFTITPMIVWHSMVWLLGRRYWYAYALRLPARATLRFVQSQTRDQQV